MRFHPILASLLLSVAAIAAPLGCSSGGGGDITSSGQGGTDGQSAGCSTTAPIDYQSCGGFTLFPDGSCTNGTCAVNDTEARIYAAWKAEVLTLSGLTEQALNQRITISFIESSPSFVSIYYVVTYDWARSLQHDAIDLGNASSPPTDAEIKKAVAIAVEEAEWKTLGTTEKVAPEQEVRAAFDGCACDMEPDWCHIDFMNVTGKFKVRGFKQVNPSQNECLEAVVDVVTAERISCKDVPCTIN